MNRTAELSRTCREALVLFGALSSLSNGAIADTFTFTQATQISENNVTYDGHDIVVQGADLTVDGLHRFVSLSVVNGGRVTHTACSTTATHKLDLQVDGVLLVDSNGSIGVGGVGYLSGRTVGNTTDGAATTTAGGTHGGVGGGSTNALYGDYRNPNEFGSGGGGGAGGGLIRIRAASLVLQGGGWIHANGQNSTSGAGSGGGIFIEVDTFQMGPSSAIAADGGVDLVSDTSRYGGGGRIAIYAREFQALTLDKISAWGFGFGTIYIRDLDEPQGTLVLQSVGVGGGGFPNGPGITYLGSPGETSFVLEDDLKVFAHTFPITVTPLDPAMTLEIRRSVSVDGISLLQLPGDVIFADSSTLTVNQDAKVRVDGLMDMRGDLVLTDLPGHPFDNSRGTLEVPGRLVSSRPIAIRGGRLLGGRIEAPGLTLTANVWGAQVGPMPPSPSAVHKLELDIDGDIVVSASQIGSLCLGGACFPLGYMAGRTKGNTLEGGAPLGAGGSHGGRGLGPSPQVYGDPLDPEEWGGGGGGAAGGGAVRIRAKSLTFVSSGVVWGDGDITANGGASTSGGGAGGSISIDVDRLVATPQTSFWAVGQSEGGGGRIAVYAREVVGFQESQMNVAGLDGGQPGTAILRNHLRYTHGRSFEPAGLNGGYLSHGFDQVDIHFNLPIDIARARLDQIAIGGPLGVILATSFTAAGDRTYRLTLPPQSRDGRYNFRVAADLLDATGTPLDQDGDGAPGELRDDDYNFTIVIDTVAPRVVQHFPDQDVTGTVDFIDVWFSEPMDGETFSPADLTLLDPSSVAIPVTKVEKLAPSRFRLSFAALTVVGRYDVKLSADIRDLAGNRINLDGDSAFGESEDDSYAASFHFVPVDLRLSNVQIQPQALIAGEAFTISWVGANASGAQLVGDWTDGIYLSRDRDWDIADLLVVQKEHTGGLPRDGTYAPSLTVYTPGALPGDYFVLVRADIGNAEREIADGEANNTVAVGPFPLTVRGLIKDGPPVQDETTAANNSRYYVVDVARGESLRLRLRGISGKCEVYVGLGAIPTRLRYDQRMLVADPNQEILLSGNPVGGRYYILVYDVGGDGKPFELSVTSGTVFISGISPHRFPNHGNVTITVTGAGFQPDMEVFVVAKDGTRLRFSNVRVLSDTALLVYHNMEGSTAGMYDIVVQAEGNSDTLVDGLEVATTPLQTPQRRRDLEVSLSVPSDLRPIGPATVWVSYSNVGKYPMAAPLLVLTAHNAQMTADPTLFDTVPRDQWLSAGYGHSVQLIATGSGETPGILQPGDSGSIPVYYIGWDQESHGFTEFAVGALTEFDVTGPPKPECLERLARTTAVAGGGGAAGAVIEVCNCPRQCLAIDWGKLSAESRPAGISSESWWAVLRGLQVQWIDFIDRSSDHPCDDSCVEVSPGASIGPSLTIPLVHMWAGYVRQLAHNSNYLHELGQPSKDVSSLFALEMAKATGSLNPIRNLVEAVDASSAAPGIPLTFRRVYGQTIPSRVLKGPLGRGWTHNWDLRVEIEGNAATIVGPGIAARTFHWSLLDRNEPKRFVGPPGERARFEQVGGSYVLTEPDGTVWRFRCEQQGIGVPTVSNPLVEVRVPNGNAVQLVVDEVGTLHSIQHSNGDRIDLTYNGDKISSIFDWTGPNATDGLRTDYVYSGDDLVRVIEPGNRITRYAYTEPWPSLVSLAAVIYPDARADAFEYNNRGRLTRVTRGNGAETVGFSYGDDGQVFVTDAAGKRVELDFTGSGQLARVRDALGNVVEMTYDRLGQLTELFGPGGELYRYAYDKQGNLVEIVDALRLPTTFRFEPKFQSLASFTDPEGHGMDYAYDPKGNLASITYEDASKETLTSDAKGNVASWKNRRGQTLNYGYNAAGQLTSKDDPATPGVVDFVYIYDAAGNLTSAKGPNGTLAMAYDPATQALLRIDYPGGRFFTFAYDDMGRRLRREDQSGDVLNYAYDAAGRLDRLTTGTDALIADYDYDGSGRLTRKALGNGVFTTYEYDAAGRLVHLVNFKPDRSVLSRFDYGYNASGQRVSMDTLEGTFHYDYDLLGQLILVQHPGSVEHPKGKATRYIYDGAGNRVEVIDDEGTTVYETNDLNQYMQVGAVKYTYDLDGNMKDKLEGGVLTKYTYDIENRLVGVTTPTETWSYEYDALGQRVAVTHNRSVRRQVIDPIGLGNVAAEYDGAGQLVARYDHGIGLLARRPGTGPAAYYTFDAIGNTREMTEAAGAVVNKYAYEPFGESLGKTEGVENDFEFAGEWGIEVLGLDSHHIRRRIYTSVHGRFVQPDSTGIRYTTQLYSYCHNDPLSMLDLTGESAVSLIGGACLVFIFELVLGEELAPVYHDTKNAWAEWLRTKPNNGNPGRRESQRRKLPDPCAGPTPNPSPPPGPTPEPPPPPAPPASSPPAAPTPDTLPAGEARGGRPAQPGDPNDKLGPAGHGPQGWITAGTLFPYTIRFENVATAEAPAAIIRITDVLDEDLDLSTLELREIAFADVTIPIPPGLNHYEDRFPYIFTLGETQTPIYVDVQASVDLETRTLTFHLEAVDPLTGWLPENPFVGLLPPTNSDGIGEGHVSYTIRHLPGLPSGTAIENKASIVFDFNDPIETPLVVNTLDDAPPESRVAPLPARVEAGEFSLEWAGSDNANGSGIAAFDIYLSINDGPYALFIDGSEDTRGDIETTAGYTYAFYSVAHDNAGHVEEAPEAADAVISVVAPVAIEAGGDLTAVEGQPVGLPGAAITFAGGVDGLDLVIEWGDGVVEPGILVAVEGGAKVTSTHHYPDEGVYTAKLCVSGLASTSACDSTRVAVSNAAPTFPPQAPRTAVLQQLFDPAVDFSDPGTADVHTGTIDWGDGSPVEAGSVVESGGAGKIHGSHVYDTLATFTATVTVTDDAGAGSSVQLRVEVSRGTLFRRGDADTNGQLQLTDPVRLLNYLFLGTVGLECLDAADADDNGQLQLTDAVRILGFLFLGGPEPAPPGPINCGVDPGLDPGADLGCVSYDLCAQ